MIKTICIFVVMALVLLQKGCNEETGSIASISIDYPHGETRLLIQRNGQAYLFYGALPQHQKIKNNTFEIHDLIKKLKPRLHGNAPREHWPNPHSQVGMVTITYENKTKSDYLIFDEEEFAENLFNKAKMNIVAQVPLMF